LPVSRSVDPFLLVWPLHWYEMGAPSGCLLYRAQQDQTNKRDSTFVARPAKTTRHHCVTIKDGSGPGKFTCERNSSVIGNHRLYALVARIMPSQRDLRRLSGQYRRHFFFKNPN
jgi:hypothetical protein